jgi:hypothetical protein
METYKKQEIVKINGVDLDLETLIFTEFDQGDTLSKVFQGLKKDKKKGLTTFTYKDNTFFATYVKTNGVIDGETNEKELVEVGAALFTAEVKKAFAADDKKEDKKEDKKVGVGNETT